MIPMIEEMAKFITLCISTPIAITFTLYFSIIEFFSYIKSFENVFGNVSYYFVMSRFVCIGLHFICLFIQYWGFEKFKRTSKTIYLLLGFLLAFSLHTFWNIGFGTVVIGIVKIFF
jgi:hypothetical protein